MAAAQIDPWYEGTPTINGHDMAVDQRVDHIIHSDQKNLGKTGQENTGAEFLCHRQHQRPNLTMATSHHDPWKRGKPTGIGRDSTAEGGITKETNAEAVTRKAAAAAARMAEQLGEQGKSCRAAHHHVRRLEFGAGRPMGSWDIIGGSQRKQMPKQ